MRLKTPDGVLLSLLGRCYQYRTCHAVCRREIQHARYIQTSISNRSDSQRHRPNIVLAKQVDLHRGTIRCVLCVPSTSFRASSTAAPTHAPKSIAVLGGGITGLTNAYYLSKTIPDAKITLYESSDRLGGWLRSVRMKAPAGGDVLFEQGPRSIRPGTPAGMVTLELIKDIGLEDDILITDKQSAAAQNRFVYYPDRLVKMPGPGQDLFAVAWSILTEPIFKGIIGSLALEMNRPARSPALADESVGSFLSRRLGSSNIGDNVASAVLHGIYAGDINKLSVKSLLPNLWQSEKQFGSILQGMWNSMKTRSNLMPYRDAILLQQMTESPENMARSSEMTAASVYSFKEGVSALTDRLVQKLQTSGNVDIRLNTKVASLSYDNRTDEITVTTDGPSTPHSHGRVVSTLNARKLSSLAKNELALSALQEIDSASVMVVNLFFEDPSILPERGFGYLIPRSIPWEQNPEAALGVVFDSDASIGQDSATGTKMTVMLGGHWWDEYSPADYPSIEEGIAMAKSLLKRHLKIDAEPVLAHVSMQQDCIPQYTVGHEDRLKRAHQELMSEFKGKLAVAGNSYTGVGLNDCVRAGKELAMEIAEWPRGCTGLEQFTTEKRWVGTQQFVVPKEDRGQE